VVGAQGKQWRKRLSRLPNGTPVAGAREAIEQYIRRFEGAHKVPRFRQLRQALKLT